MIVLSEKMSLLSHFPGKPFDIQIHVLKQVEQAINSGFKYIVIQAPTGTGKSFIGATIARFKGTSSILSSTTDLEDQYNRDFPWMYTIRGKSHFDCKQLQDQFGHLKQDGIKIKKNELKCDKGECFDDLAKKWCKYHPDRDGFKIENKGTLTEKIIHEESEQNFCSYYLQKFKALVASHTIFNYAVYLSLMQYTHELPTKNVLIWDEAHDLENHIVNFYGITIWKGWADFTNTQFPKFRAGEDKDVAKWLEYLKVLSRQYKEFIDTCRASIRAGKQTNAYNHSTLKKAEERAEKIEFVMQEIMGDMNNYVVTKVNRDLVDNIKSVNIEPIDISKQGVKMFASAGLNVFMSATINKQVFCRSAGIPSHECIFIEVKHTPFAVQNRMVNFLNVARLGANSSASDMDTVVRKIDELMSKHRNEKGLILTTSYKQVSEIEIGLSEENASRLMRTGNEYLTRSDILKNHIESKKPAVLISPSLWQGIDLKDNQSRFQIIVKAPFLDLGDGRINAKRNLDPRWYNVQSAMKLIQGCGRSIRHHEDYAVTYVLDTNATSLLNRISNEVPDWFKESVRGVW